MKRRKMLTPAFHFSILEQFIEVFDSVGNVFIERIGQEKGKFDIYPYVTLCTLDVICGKLFNVKTTKQFIQKSQKDLKKKSVVSKH